MTLDQLAITLRDDVKSRAFSMRLQSSPIAMLDMSEEMMQRGAGDDKIQLSRATRPKLVLPNRD